MMNSPLGVSNSDCRFRALVWLGGRGCCSDSGSRSWWQLYSGDPEVLNPKSFHQVARKYNYKACRWYQPTRGCWKPDGHSGGLLCQYRGPCALLSDRPLPSEMASRRAWGHPVPPQPFWPRSVLSSPCPMGDTRARLFAPHSVFLLHGAASQAMVWLAVTAAGVRRGDVVLPHDIFCNRNWFSVMPRVILLKILWKED